jgi:hypothetical protein
MLTLSRAAAAGRGPEPVLEALAESIRSALSFQVVVVNLRDPDTEALRVVVVTGDNEAREKLLGTSAPWAEWKQMLDHGRQIAGAAWLPAGSYAWGAEAVTWAPPSVPPPGPDAWQPDDALLLPVRGSDGLVLAVVSVDQPLLGRRPSDDEVTILMAVADHAGLALEQAQRDGAQRREQSQELRLAAVMLLAETLDLRDSGTAQHSRTVGDLARQIAERLGFPPDRIERIHAAGVLHDLGKLGIADAILHKPGALTEAEWEEMKRHPEIGAQILEHAGMNDIAKWVLAHHERLDGRGYPLGVPPEQVCLEARILSVADAYEAMIADRPYRRGMPQVQARAELERCSGTQFDRRVVAALCAALDEHAAGAIPLPLPVEPARALRVVA